VSADAVCPHGLTQETCLACKEEGASIGPTPEDHVEHMRPSLEIIAAVRDAAADYGFSEEACELIGLAWFQKFVLAHHPTRQGGLSDADLRSTRLLFPSEEDLRIGRPQRYADLGKAQLMTERDWQEVPDLRILGVPVAVDVTKVSWDREEFAALVSEMLKRDQEERRKDSRARHDLLMRSLGARR
jgi:hypothetical protein